MKSLILSAFSATLLLVLASNSPAQPRPMERSAAAPAKKTEVPSTFAAEYMGGINRFKEKRKGQLKFDDENERLVFYGEDQKELFHIPYSAMLAIYPQSKSVTSTAGSVISHIPVPGAGLAGYLKEKRQYLVMQIDDSDAGFRGTISFKIENKQLLDAVIVSLADKADLEQVGDAYHRSTDAKPSN